jgi:hypothetical protein
VTKASVNDRIFKGGVLAMRVLMIGSPIGGGTTLLR